MLIKSNLITCDEGLREPGSKRTYDVNGWFTIDDNPLSKVGVYEYYGWQMGIPGVEPDKIYSVLRPAETLKDTVFLESIKLLPWIDGHVMLGEEGSVVRGKAAEEKGVEGVIGEKVYFDEKNEEVRGNVKVFSEDLKRQIESGKKELSLGYTSKYEYKPGSYEGQGYDFIQRELRGNHLALVEKGRMGSKVAVLDEQLGFFNNENGETMNEEEIAKALALHRGITFDAALQIVKGSNSTATMDMEAESIKKMVKDECKAAMDGLPNIIKTAMDGYMADMSGQGTGMDEAALAEKEQLEAKNVELLAENEKLQGIAQDQAAAVELEKKKELFEKLSPATGTFDYGKMSLTEMAVYGLGKLELKAPDGAEVAVLETHLDAVQGSGGRFAVEDSQLENKEPSKAANWMESE